MQDSFDVYVAYLAVRRHFTSKNYNFNKYNGKVNAKKSSFLKRRDKGLFNRIRYKYKTIEQIRDFFIANIVYNSDFSIYNTTSESCHEIYDNWQRRTKNIVDYYYKDLRFLSQESVKDIMISKSGELPKVIQYYIQDKICLETLVLLDIYFKFLNRNELLEDDEQFQEYAIKIKKYKSFLYLDLNRLKKITLETLK